MSNAEPRRRTVERNGRRVVVETWGRDQAVSPGGAASAQRRAFRSAAGSPGGASVDIAANILDDVFAAMANHTDIDAAVISKSSGTIVDAIDDVGLATWLDTVRSHHQGTFQHCLIVTGVATFFARKTGMRRADAATLTTAGLLHDIGKAGIPVGILDKPGKLTADEFAVIKAHPVAGYDYLVAQGSASPEVLAAVRGHHEYLDGSGYPDGLAGTRIGDVTRILTICDVYGALIESRAYKPPKTPHEAGEILLAMANEGRVERSLVRALLAE